jgi:hypothetical protein
VLGRRLNQGGTARGNHIPSTLTSSVRPRRPAINLPERVTVALGELAGAAKQGLLALSVGVGLAVVGEIFEEENTDLGGTAGQA